MWWLSIAIVAATLVAIWIVFALYLLVARPDETTIRETLRLLPDSFRLLRRLSTDRSIPFRTRILVWVLLVYLASPIDLIPDFIPVIGYADDVVISSVVLRHLVKRAGPEKLREHWPGSPDGLARLLQLLRIREEA